MQRRSFLASLFAPLVTKFIPRGVLITPASVAAYPTVWACAKIAAEQTAMLPTLERLTRNGIITRNEARAYYLSI